MVSETIALYALSARFLLSWAYYLTLNVHGRVTEAYKLEGLPGWEKFRLWIYTPPGGNIKRSYTRDGRGDDPVYEMIY